MSKDKETSVTSESGRDLNKTLGLSSLPEDKETSGSGSDPKTGTLSSLPEATSGSLQCPPSNRKNVEKLPPCTIRWDICLEQVRGDKNLLEELLAELLVEGTNDSFYTHTYIRISHQIISVVALIFYRHGCLPRLPPN